MTSTAVLVATIDSLVDGWCERRNLKALRYILAAWPSSLALTDDWEDLCEALRNVLALAHRDLSAAEINAAEEAIVAIDTALRARDIPRP